MFPVTQIKVKNVNVYPYLPDPIGGGPGPVVFPVIEGAEGVLTLTWLGVRIQIVSLEIEGGTRHGELYHKGNYQFAALNEEGQPENIPWLVCQNVGPRPIFSRTIGSYQLPGGGSDKQEVLSDHFTPAQGDYIDLGPLTAISVIKPFGKFMPGFEILVENGTGELIGTRTGTPHLMGVRIDTGIVGHFEPGQTGLCFQAKTQSGRHVYYNDLEVVSPDNPVILMQKFG